jgi:hypothetical protein
VIILGCLSTGLSPRQRNGISIKYDNWSLYQTGLEPSRSNACIIITGRSLHCSEVRVFYWDGRFLQNFWRIE